MKTNLLQRTFFLSLLTLLSIRGEADNHVVAEQTSQNTPEGWQTVNLPIIPDITPHNTIYITDYGATISSADNTIAIQKALNAVPASGGMVVIPAGEWLCGPVKLKSKTILHLAAHATLKLLPYGIYPAITSSSIKFDNFIDVQKNATDIIIEGEDKYTSLFDGQGKEWWIAYENNKSISRGAVIRMSKGTRFLIRNVMVKNAPGVNISIGQNGKGSHGTVHDVIIRELLHVYDVTNEENADPNFRERLDKIGFQYVSSQLVRPVVYLGTIDLANVDSVRSSDVLGDIRQYVEWELLNYISLIYQNSFYKHQLNAGEKPMFKVFTSSVILENIFSIPHIHNHLNTESPVDGSSVEYRRVLPNGTILDCVTCTFNYMRDKVVMIPYRENAPEDILNFGHNWDYGTFVAHYNPQLDNAVNKRVFSNTRSMVIPTNPMGLYLDVHHLDEFIDMFQVTNPTSSKLPQPSELNVDKQGA